MKNYYQIIESEMLQVNECILSHLHSKEELVEVVAKYLLNSGGKRIRPSLTLLCAGLCGYNGGAHIKLAAAVEFIHAATLLHDDVVDNSNMRRFQKSANVVWGNKTSILVGDFLFSQSFKMMVDAGSLEALSRLSSASVCIAEGEVVQLARLSEKRMLSIDEYEQIIRSKTSELFSAACEVGGIISSNDRVLSKKLGEFGARLGVIFQIVDDVLDYFGRSSDLGKNIGDDFYEGKITLPVILLRDRLKDSEKSFLESILFLDVRTKQEFDEILFMLSRHDIKTQIMDYVARLVTEAAAGLDQIPGISLYKDSLKELLYHSSARAN